MIVISISSRKHGGENRNYEHQQGEADCIDG